MSAPFVDIVPETGDKAEHVVLCSEVGKILAATYGEWTWYVEIPPDQGVLIVRNLDLTQHGTNKPWCMSIPLSKIALATLKVDVVRAAGELLERYERHRGHAGRFRPVDLAGKICLTPQT